MFSQNLRELRMSVGYTQTQLGALLHLSRTTISNYEAGRLEPSLDTLIKLSQLFDISIDSIVK